MVTSLFPNCTGAEQPFVILQLPHETSVYLSFLGALLPSVYCPDSTALLKRACKGRLQILLGGLGCRRASLGASSPIAPQVPSPATPEHYQNNSHLFLRWS